MSDGIDKGELRRVCTEPSCPVHHPKKQTPKSDASYKAEQEKRRREEALANATGIRVLQSIVTAVPVRLMKRDLVFIAAQLLPSLDEKRLGMIARNRSIKAKNGVPNHSNDPVPHLVHKQEARHNLTPAAEQQLPNPEGHVQDVAYSLRRKSAVSS